LLIERGESPIGKNKIGGRSLVLSDSAVRNGARQPGSARLKEIPACDRIHGRSL
jgi:hypothetical protein